jgi:hypothetical protein
VGRGGPEASYPPWRGGTIGPSRLLAADRPAAVPAIRRQACLSQPQAPHRPEPAGFPPRPSSALHQPHQRRSPVRQSPGRQSPGRQSPGRRSPVRRSPVRRSWQRRESRLPRWLQAPRQRPTCSPVGCRSLCLGPQRAKSRSRHWWRVGMARDKNTGPAQPFRANSRFACNCPGGPLCPHHEPHETHERFPVPVGRYSPRPHGTSRTWLSRAGRLAASPHAQNVRPSRYLRTVIEEGWTSERI